MPLTGKGKMGRRRRRRREPVALWWGAFAVLGVIAWLAWSWRVGLLLVLLWCLYEFCLVPASCRIMSREGFSCAEPVRGRLFGCTPAHQQIKSDALWRLVGLRNPFRKPPVLEPNRVTGVLVVSPAVRGRLEPMDRVVLLAAGAGTLVTVAGAVLGVL